MLSVQIALVSCSLTHPSKPAAAAMEPWLSNSASSSSAPLNFALPRCKIAATIFHTDSISGATVLTAQGTRRISGRT